MDANALKEMAEQLRQARRIVVFTGAGMSAESGIGTFRNAPDSHWSRFDPHELASPEGWRANPRRVWAWYEGRRAEVLAAQPNAGHLAIAQLTDVLRQRTGRGGEQAGQQQEGPHQRKLFEQCALRARGSAQ